MSHTTNIMEMTGHAQKAIATMNPTIFSRGNQCQRAFKHCQPNTHPMKTGHKYHKDAMAIATDFCVPERVVCGGGVGVRGWICITPIGHSLL
jgi:hypothetical protein